VKADRPSNQDCPIVHERIAPSRGIEVLLTRKKQPNGLILISQVYITQINKGATMAKSRKNQSNSPNFVLSDKCMAIRNQFEMANAQFFNAAVLCFHRAPESLRTQCITEVITNGAAQPFDRATKQAVSA